MPRLQLSTGVILGLALLAAPACTPQGPDPSPREATQPTPAPATPPARPGLGGAPLPPPAADGREPRRVDLRPLVQHHQRQERERAGPPPPIVEEEVEGGWIVYISEEDGAPAIHRIRASAGGHQRLSRGDRAHYPAAPLPGGELLVIEVDESEPGVHLERLIRLAPSGEVTPLSETYGRARNPSIPADGSWMVFEGDPASFSDLYRIGLRPPVPARRLTDNAEGNFEPSVSPDGRRIAFVSSRDSNPELYVMAADGQRARRLTDNPGGDTTPRWSPDGRQLAWLSDRGQGDRIHLVDTAAVDAARTPSDLNPRRLTADPDLLAEAEHRWAPDGARIALLGVGDRTTSVWVADVASGNLRRVTDDGALDQGPTWSPSGAHLVFASNRDGELDIYRVDANGGAPVRLTQAPGADWLPLWLPEGALGDPPPSDNIRQGE